MAGTLCSEQGQRADAEVQLMTAELWSFEEVPTGTGKEEEFVER